MWGQGDSFIRAIPDDPARGRRPAAAAHGARPRRAPAIATAPPSPPISIAGDGCFHLAVRGAPEDVDLAAERAAEPRRFGRWTREGSGFVLADHRGRANDDARDRHTLAPTAADGGSRRLLFACGARKDPPEIDRAMILVGDSVFSRADRGGPLPGPGITRPGPAGASAGAAGSRP